MRLDTELEDNRSSKKTNENSTLPLPLDRLDRRALELAVRIRPKKDRVPCLEPSRVDDAIDDGPHVRHRPMKKEW